MTRCSELPRVYRRFFTYVSPRRPRNTCRRKEWVFYERLCKNEMSARLCSQVSAGYTHLPCREDVRLQNKYLPEHINDDDATGGCADRSGDETEAEPPYYKKQKRCGHYRNQRRACHLDRGPRRGLHCPHHSLAVKVVVDDLYCVGKCGCERVIDDVLISGA